MSHCYQLPEWKAHRLIPSSFPPINIFESIYDSEDELRIAFELEGLTNDRLAAQTGSLSLVRENDCISGPGTTPIMAVFTHIGYESRFTDGQFGVYYSASSLEASIKETMYHKTLFLAATHEGDTEITMRQYVNKVIKPLVDVRDKNPLHHPDDYKDSQAFGRTLFDEAEWGILFNSVRCSGAECAALLRPPAMTPCTQGAHFRYVWNGQEQKFTTFFKISES